MDTRSRSAAQACICICRSRGASGVTLRGRAGPERAPAERVVREVDDTSDMSLQAKLPNGVTVELRGVGLRQLADVVQMLGRMQCSASTTI